MERLEKYAWMQRIRLLHGPIQIMMCGVSWVARSFLSYFIPCLIVKLSRWLLCEFYVKQTDAYGADGVRAIPTKLVNNVSYIWKFFRLCFIFTLLLRDVFQLHKGDYFTTLGTGKLRITEEELQKW